MSHEQLGFTKNTEQEFAELLYSFLLADNEVDQFELPKAFAKITSEIDVKLLQRQSLNKNYSLESKFWDLVDLLVGFRNSEQHNIDVIESLSKRFNSNSSFLDNYLSNDSNLKEIWLIITWIRSNLMFLEIDSWKAENNKWLNTKLALQENNVPQLFSKGPSSNQKVNLVQSLDYDATVREEKTLASSDLANDATFYKKLYYLVIARQDSQALELCQQTNNWTYYMILQGLNDYIDPSIDVNLNDADSDDAPQGIKNKYLWRRACFQLSQISENVHQKALLEYLSGAVTNNLALNNKSWEISLLVYLNAFLVNNMEKYLILIDKVADTDPFIVPELSRVESVNDILIELASTPSLKDASDNNFRLLMGSLMLNNIPNFIESFLSEEFNAKVLQAADVSNDVYSDLDDDLTDLTDDSDITYKDQDGDYEESYEELETILAKDPNYDNYNIYLLRVLVHLTIYSKIIDNTSVWSGTLTALIQLYLKKLFKKGLFNLLPIYIKFLPAETPEDAYAQRKIYSYYLSKIILKENRAEQIKTCQYLGLPNLRETLIDTVDLVINKYNDYYLSFIDDNKGSIIISDNITDIDRTFYGSIDWLLKIGNLNHVVVNYVNQIFVKFLLSGKINSLLEFAKSYSFKEIIKKADVEVDIFTAKFKTQYKNESDTDIEIDTNGEILNNDNYVSDRYKQNKKFLLNILKLVDEGFAILHQYEEYLIEKNLNPVRANSKSSIINDANNWKNEIIKEDLTAKFITPVKNLIINNLVKLDISDDEFVNTTFKNLYVPYFIISLHKILVNSRFCDVHSSKKDTTKDLENLSTVASDSFLKQAIQLSVLVANSKNQFIKYFLETNRLKEYLKLIAECSALAGEDTIYD